MVLFVTLMQCSQNFNGAVPIARGPALSPMRRLGVNLLMRRFIFRTSLEGPPRNNSQPTNHRRAMTMDALRHLSTREAMTIERSSKQDSTQEKLTQRILRERVCAAFTKGETPVSSRQEPTSRRMQFHYIFVTAIPTRFQSFRAVWRSFQVTVGCNYAIAVARFDDWLKNLAPVRSKTETYRTMRA